VLLSSVSLPFENYMYTSFWREEWVVPSTTPLKACYFYKLKFLYNNY